MHYEYVVVPDAEVPRAVEPAFRHALDTCASEVNKTARAWRAIPDHLLDTEPHQKVNTTRTIAVHQLLSERRFFAEFAGLDEPSVEGLLPVGERPAVAAYIDRYVGLAKGRLPQFASGTTAWWLEERLLRRAAAATGVGVLAAGAAYLPPPHAGPDVAPAGRTRTGARDLRTARRREVGRCRPDGRRRSGAAM